MNKQKFIEYLRNPTAVTDQTISDLEQVVEEYPYFQSARTLLAKAGKLKKNEKASRFTATAATYATDRALLKRYLNDKLIFLSTVNVHESHEVDHKSDRSKEIKETKSVSIKNKPATNPPPEDKPQQKEVITNEEVASKPASAPESTDPSPEQVERSKNLDHLIEDLYHDMEELKVSREKFLEFERKMEEEEAVDKVVKKATTSTSGVNATPEKKSEVKTRPASSSSKPKTSPKSTTTTSARSTATKPAGSQKKPTSSTSRPSPKTKSTKTAKSTAKATTATKSSATKPKASTTKTSASTQKTSPKKRTTAKSATKAKPEKSITKATTAKGKAAKTTSKASTTKAAKNTKTKTTTRKSSPKKTTTSTAKKATPKSTSKKATAPKASSAAKKKTTATPSAKKSTTPTARSASRKTTTRKTGTKSTKTSKSDTKDDKGDPGVNQQELIANFIKHNPSITPADGSRNAEHKHSIEDLSGDSTSFNPAIGSEYLAEIYLEQGKTERAIEIYQSLMLKFPEKKSYFAGLIKKLK